MRRLALFPLPVAFFPGFPIQLNIFEERYKEMLADCLHGDGSFGVVLIQEGCEALGPLAKPHQVGILAKITKLRESAQDSIYLEARGITRFWIRDLNYGKNYLRGQVKIEKTKPSNDENNRHAQELLPLFHEYMGLLDPKLQQNINFAELPRDARCLTYLTASFLQIPQLQKQALLETQETKAMSAQLIQKYRRQIRLLKLMQGKAKQEKQYPSLN